MARVGRPSTYKPEFAKQAKKLCQLGATDMELADYFGIPRTQLYRWRNAYPEFARATKIGKRVADDLVERSLYQRAVGYSHEAEKIMQHQGKAVRVKYVEHYPPDTVACLAWLNNRKPKAWRRVIPPDQPGDDSDIPPPIAVTIEFKDARRRPEEEEEPDPGKVG